MHGQASHPDNPFNYHYDVVTLDSEVREGCRNNQSPWVPVVQMDPDTDVETLYFQVLSGLSGSVCVCLTVLLLMCLTVSCDVSLCYCACTSLF